MFLPAPSYFQTLNDSGSLAARNWQQLGLKVNLVTHPNWATFTSQIPDRSKWDAAIQGFVANPMRLDPDDFLTRPFMSKFIENNGPNYGGYSNTEYDRVAALTQTSMDPKQRQDAVYKAQEILAKDLPLIALAHPNTISVYNKRKFEKVYSVPGVGLMNPFNFLNAEPKGADKSIVFSYVGAFNSLNPLNAPGYDIPLEFQRLVYDTLGKVDEKGDPRPWAAESWNVADDNTVSVRLRPGLKFTDGHPLTAEDVRFSFQFIRDNKVGIYAAALSAIGSTEVKDDRNLVIHLDRPFAGLIPVTFTQVPILPKHIWEGVAAREGVANPVEWPNPQAVGSGPLKVQSFAPGQEAVFVRNPEHFQPMKAERLVVKTFSSADTRFLALQKGEVDFIESKGLSPNQNIQAKQDPNLGYIDEPGITVYWMVFNMTKGPFQDYAFRDAIAHTIDYDTITRDVFQGQAQAGRGVIGPGNAKWHDTGIPEGDQGGASFFRMDMGRAKKILADAGYTWDAQGRLHYPANFKPQTLPR